MKIETVNDEYPDLSFLEQTYDDVDINERERYLKQKKGRSEQYNQGYWHMIGIRAKATIMIPMQNSKDDVYIIQEVSSSGLWGIESDSSNEFLDEIKKEQVDELKYILSVLNVNIPSDLKIEEIEM